MPTFGACGGGANAPRAPPWLRTCYTYTLRTSLLTNFFFSAVIANFLEKGFCDDSKFLQHYTIASVVRQNILVCSIVRQKYSSLCIGMAIPH